MTTPESGALPRERAGAVAGAAPLPLHLALGWVLAGSLELALNLGLVQQRRVGRGLWAVTEAVDLGRHVGLGMASMAAVWLLRRHAAPLPWLGWLLLIIVSFGLGSFSLPTDLDGLAERLAEVSGLPGWLASAGVVSVVSGSVPLLAWLTQPRWRPSRRALAVVRALGVGLCALGSFWLNMTISPGSNPSAHLYLSWVTALLFGHLLAPLDWNGAAPGPFRAASYWAAAAASAWGLWALFSPHPNSVLIQLARRPSSLHLLAVLHRDGGLDNVEATLAARGGPFFAPRDALPTIPSSRGPAPNPPPVVIFFSFDSLRADVLSKVEHARHLPNLVELRQAGIHFQNARAPGSMTKYTLGAISISKYFSQQYWSERGQSRWPVEDKSVHLARLLSDAGVFTAAFPATQWLQEDSGLMRGFHQNELSGEPMPGRQTHWIAGRSLTDQLLAALEKQKHSGRPSFFWVHYLDTHDPFYAGGKGGAKFLRYLRALGVVDGYLGEVRRAIEQLGLGERSLLMVLSDHGEAFGEHDSFFHGGSLYDELLRVPLVVSGAGIAPRSVDVPVSLIDLAPTILDWFGLATPAAFMGQSLVPFLLGKERSFARPIVAETRLKQAMLFGDGYKVIRDLRRDTLELYDLAADPGELNNLSDNIDPDAEEHVLIMRSFFQVHTYRENGYRVPYVK